MVICRLIGENDHGTFGSTISLSRILRQHGVRPDQVHQIDMVRTRSFGDEVFKVGVYLSMVCSNDGQK